VNEIKKRFANNVQKYVEFKRPKIAAVAAAASANAGAPQNVQTAVAHAANNLPVNVTPQNAGKIVASAALGANATPSQAAAASQAAANEQALSQGATPNAAKNEGLVSATNVALENSTTPTAVINNSLKANGIAKN